MRTLTSRLLVIAVAAVLASPLNAEAEGVSVSEATPEQAAEAQRLFESGQTKIEAGDHQGALTDFQASFDVVKSPNSLLLVERELVVLGRLADAYRAALATEQLAAEAAKTDPKYADTALAGRNESNELAPKIGFIKLDLGGKSGSITVNGRVIANSEQSDRIAVDPGPVVVELRTADGATTRQSATVAAGGEVAVSFAPPKPPPDEPPAPKAEAGMSPFDMGTGQRITGGILAGIGVVGMGMFAGFGAAHLSIHSDLTEQCPGGKCAPSLAEQADDGETFQTAANVSVIVGAVGLAAGAALLIPTFFGGDKKESTAFVVGPGFVGLEGRFQ
jgi:hypothetical protein